MASDEPSDSEEVVAVGSRALDVVRQGYINLALEECVRVWALYTPRYVGAEGQGRLAFEDSTSPLSHSNAIGMRSHCRMISYDTVSYRRRLD